MPRLVVRERRLASFAFVAGTVAACLLGPAPATAAPTAPRTTGAAGGAPLGDPSSEDLQSTWRQLLMAPRITGNLRTVAVDPSNPQSVWVGTEEGTLAHSNDGGVTWEEVEISPFLLKSPTIEPKLEGDNHRAIDVFAGFNVRVGTDVYPFYPINRRSSGQGVPIVAPPITDVTSLFVHSVRFAENKEPLLDTVSKDAKPFEEVQLVRVCPGGAHSLLVSTTAKLWGSPDGVSFVPLFVTREKEPIQEIRCAPDDPNEVILTTGDGTFRSVDGGHTFDQMGGALGPIAAAAAAFGPPAESGGRAQFYVATGRDLWIGDTNHPEAMRTATLGGDVDLEIRDIAATTKTVWLATDAGVRVSRDGGTTWAAIDELEGTDWQVIAVSPAPAGGVEHILVLRNDVAFESTDGGATFHPSFRGESRRRLRHVVQQPADGGAQGFLLLTSGELWTSRRNSAADDRRVHDEPVRRWAERRLRSMPPVSVTLNRALARAGISAPQVDRMMSSLRARGWLPGAKTTFSWARADLQQVRQTSITDPTLERTANAVQNFGVYLDLVWELPDVVSPVTQFERSKARLYDLRLRFSYVIEDAYDERKHLLVKLATGGLDAEQLLTLQARCEALDTVIQEFTGEPPPR